MMSTTEGNAARAQNQAVMSTLQGILSLPDAQRSTLIRTWIAIDPVVGDFTAEKSQVRADEVTVLDQAEIDQAAMAELEAWMASISGESRRRQYRKLEDALQRTETDEERAKVGSAMVSLINSDSVFAVEIATTKYAHDHPFQVVAGLLGIGLLFLAFGKGWFRLLF